MQAFLSHSSADNILAEKIYKWLRDQVASVWFDRIELRPSDSLMDKIAAGIAGADVLLVLVTEESKKSPWVEKEVSMALAKGMDGTGPKVIPLLVEGCEIPTILADKIYIRIDEEKLDFDEIIPAIFRDSYILEVALDAQNLELDVPNLREGLHDYCRSAFDSIRVRIKTHDFNKKVREIAEKTITQEGTPPPVIEQIRRKSDFFPMSLPIYWTNLSDLIAQLADEVFTRFGKNVDAQKVAAKSIDNTLKYSQYIMSSHLQSAIFPMYAEDFGFPDIARFIRRYEKYNEEGLMRQICKVRPSEHMTHVGLEGLKQRKVNDAKLYLLNISDTDRMLLQFTCKVDEVIIDSTWYVYCLPQILSQFLSWTAFREGKPLHELEYVAGLKMDDYGRLGLN